MRQRPLRNPQLGDQESESQSEVGAGRSAAGTLGVADTQRRQRPAGARGGRGRRNGRSAVSAFFIRVNGTAVVSDLMYCTLHCCCFFVNLRINTFDFAVHDSIYRVICFSGVVEIDTYCKPCLYL